MTRRRVFAVVSLTAAAALSTAALVPATGSTQARLPPASGVTRTAVSTQATLHQAHASRAPATSSRPTAAERALQRIG